MLKEVSGKLKIEFIDKNKKTVSYVQEKVPLKKAIEYTDGVIHLYEEAAKKGLPGATERDLLDYQVGFIANLFDAKEVTKELLYENLDTNERKTIEDIILYRVLGKSREETENGDIQDEKKMD